MKFLRQLLIGVFIALIAAELRFLSLKIAQTLIRLAAGLMGEEQAPRFREEWLRHVQDIGAERPITVFLWGLRSLGASVKISLTKPPAVLEVARDRHVITLFRPVGTILLRSMFVLGLALVLTVPALLALSARALPGDPLYSTKLAFENVRLAMARDPAKAVDFHVEFAQRRISELDRLTNRGLPDQAAIAPVLSSLEARQNEAVQGIDLLKQEGKPVGVIGERVAVTLQRNTARLIDIRSDTGCNPDGSDPRCQVIAVAVTGAEQALAKVGEQPSFPDGVLAIPTLPRTPRSRRGTEPVPGADQNPSGGKTEPTEPSATPTHKETRTMPAPGGHISPGPSARVQTSLDEFRASAEPMSVTIDIKPFDSTNTLDVVNRTDLPVIVKGTPDFDPSTLDISSICFGRDPSDPTRSDCHAQGRVFGLPGAGRPDLILVFKMADTGIRAGDTQACLTGRTKDGKTEVRGCDKVAVIAVIPNSSPPIAEIPNSSPPRVFANDRDLLQRTAHTSNQQPIQP